MNNSKAKYKKKMELFLDYTGCTCSRWLTNRSGSGIIIPLKNEFVEKICTCLGNKSPVSRVKITISFSDTL